MNSLPSNFAFDLLDGCLQRCTVVQLDGTQFLVPCGSKLLRKTDRKGGENRLFNYSVDCTPSLHNLGDLNSGSSAGEEVPLVCNRVEGSCGHVQFASEQKQTTEDRIDWVFGVRWSPENF